MDTQLLGLSTASWAMLAGVLSVLAYSLMQLLFKRAGAVGSAGSVNPIVLTAWLGLMAPVWAVLLAIGLPSGLVVLEHSWPYWAYTTAWAALSVITMFLMIGILQRISLTEFTAYRKALVTALVLLADVFIFGEQFALPALVCIGAIVAASVALTWQAVPPVQAVQKTKKAKPAQRPGVAGTLVFMLGLAAALALQLLVYKQAVLLQPDLLSHVFAAKFLAAVMSVGLFALPSVRAAKLPVKTSFILLMIACFFIGSVFEAAAIKHLPLTVVMILSMVAATAFAVHDMWRRDLPRSWQVASLIALILGGFALLSQLT